jgi:lysozyme
MNSWTLGTDTSHWSGDINFTKMYNAGARFWITKATDANRSSGYQFEDDRFDNYCKDAFRFGKLLTGCYHWLQYSVDPKTAADFYLERYSRFDFDFPPILDFEEPSVTNHNDYAWRAQIWLEHVKDKTGRTPIVYTAKWFTSRFLASKLSWMSAYPLWVADYTWWANNVTKAPYYMPSNVWDDWHIWQFQANGRGNEFGVQAKSIDLNWYQGSLADLRLWLDADSIEPLPLTIEERVEVLEKEVERLKKFHE